MTSSSNEILDRQLKQGKLKEAMTYIQAKQKIGFQPNFVPGKLTINRGDINKLIHRDLNAYSLTQTP